MPEGKLVELMLTQLPNFVGFVVAVWLMKRQNDRLYELLRDCYKSEQPEVE